VDYSTQGISRNPRPEENTKAGEMLLSAKFNGVEIQIPPVI